MMLALCTAVTFLLPCLFANSNAYFAMRVDLCSVMILRLSITPSTFYNVVIQYNLGTRPTYISTCYIMSNGGFLRIACCASHTKYPTWLAATNTISCDQNGHLQPAWLAMTNMTGNCCQVPRCDKDPWCDQDPRLKLLVMDGCADRRSQSVMLVVAGHIWFDIECPQHLWARWAQKGITGHTQVWPSTNSNTKHIFAYNLLNNAPIFNFVCTIGIL